MYSFDSRVRFSEVGQNQQMTLTSVLNYFQDCSTFHSAHTHMNINDLTDYGYAWLMASWQVGIERYPSLGEHISTSTWAYGFKGSLGHRNFTIRDASGEVCAYANSYWTFVDLSSMHPVRIPQDVIDAYEICPEFEMDKAPRKIKLLEGGIPGEALAVQGYHIDTYDHVNNANYVMLAQELLPEDFSFRQMRAEYKNAATKGDLLIPTCIQTEDLFQVSLGNGAGLTYAIIEFTRR